MLSLERALAIRRMVIARMQEPPDEMGYKLRKQMYEAKGAEIDAEAQAARALINAVIDDDSTPSDNAALARIENRIENLVDDSRRNLREVTGQLLSELEARDLGRRDAASRAPTRFATSSRKKSRPFGATC